MRNVHAKQQMQVESPLRTGGRACSTAALMAGAREAPRSDSWRARTSRMRSGRSRLMDSLIAPSSASVLVRSAASSAARSSCNEIEESDFVGGRVLYACFVSTTPTTN